MPSLEYLDRHAPDEVTVANRVVGRLDATAPDESRIERAARSNAEW